ncbi:MAG: tripartite tricarboxylate transporter substrate binding protein [Devosia sp.]
MTLKTHVLGVVLAGIAVVAPWQAMAQAYPERPIELLLGFAAGSATDTVARYYAMQLQEELGQPVVVKNAPGASQYVAISSLTSARPDGYTLMVATGSAMSQGPGVRDDLPYDPLTDFMSVALLATTPGLFVTTPGLPVNNMEEFIAYATEHPNELNYGSSGLGSASNLQIELLKSRVGIDMVHIPYEGSAQIMTAIISGEAQFGVGPIDQALSSIEGGIVRGLAVSGDTRSPLLPDVPTLSELGGFDLEALDPYTYYVVVAPNGTPQPIVDKVNAALNAISASDGAKEYLESKGFNPVTQTPAEALEFVRTDTQTWIDFREATGFKFEQ